MKNQGLVMIFEVAFYGRNKGVTKIAITSEILAVFKVDKMDFGIFRSFFGALF